MVLKKCPICELNYVRAEEKSCNVCNRSKVKSSHEERAMCIVCAEHSVREGMDMCTHCMREQERRDSFEAFEKPSADSAMNNLEVNALDEINVPTSDDIPSEEYRVIRREFAMEDDSMDELQEDMARAQ